MDIFGAAKEPPADETVDVEVAHAALTSKAATSESDRMGAASGAGAAGQSDGSGFTEDSVADVMRTLDVAADRYKLHRIMRRSQIVGGGRDSPCHERAVMIQLNHEGYG
jgi:hypothetical protein